MSEQNKEKYEKGRLYQWNGTAFIAIELTDQIKLPVTEEAATVVKSVRKAAHQLIGMRPELSLCASAMLLAAAERPDMADRVKAYGQRIYAA